MNDYTQAIENLSNSQNCVQIFENAELGSVRTLCIDGEPWFVGKDVADVLGYTNSRKALADHVDDEDKGVTNRSPPAVHRKLSSSTNPVSIPSSSPRSWRARDASRGGSLPRFFRLSGKPETTLSRTRPSSSRH